MFGSKKVDTSSYAIDDIKNMLGYVLQNRATILSREDISPLEEPLTGILGFMPGVETELDGLVLYFVFKAYKEFGMEMTNTESAFTKLFHELMQHEVYDKDEAEEVHQKLISTVHAYQQRGSNKEVARLFISKLTGKFETDMRTVALVASNFNKLERNVRDNIRRDIEAV